MALAVTVAGAATSAAYAGSRRHGSHLDLASSHSTGDRWSHHGRVVHRGALRHWASALQCVPFARENSGIELSGNASAWWDNAEGLYQRGAKPEVGSILNFRANGRMRMGHVAVVTNVLDSRHIEIDHANWSAPGRVSRDIDVVDVSPDNDWTAVRVAIAPTEEEFGGIYPTYGFIYDRPDSGVMVANAGVMPAPTLNAAPADLRPSQDRIDTATAATAPEEVAEAADDPAPKSYHHRYGHGRSVRAHFHGRTVGRTTGGSASVYRVDSRAATVTHHRRHRS